MLFCFDFFFTCCFLLWRFINNAKPFLRQWAWSIFFNWLSSCVQIDLFMLFNFCMQCFRYARVKKLFYLDKDPKKSRGEWKLNNLVGLNENWTLNALVFRVTDQNRLLKQFYEQSVIQIKSRYNSKGIIETSCTRTDAK